MRDLDNFARGAKLRYASYKVNHVNAPSFVILPSQSLDGNLRENVFYF